MAKGRISVAGMDTASCNFEESTVSGDAFELLNPAECPSDVDELVSEVNRRAMLGNEKYHNAQLREEMLAKGFDAGMYICHFDEKENMVSFEFTDGTRRMLGYDGLDDLPDEFESWTKTLVPEEKDILVKLFWDSVRNHRTLPDISHATYRMRKKDGSLIWVTGAGRFVCRDDGSLKVYMGCYREVTAEHDKDEYLRIIEGVGKVFNFSIYIDMPSETYRIISTNEFVERVQKCQKAFDFLRANVDASVDADFHQQLNEWLQPETVLAELEKGSVSSRDFYSDAADAWFRGIFMVGDRDEDGSIRHLIYGCQNIDEQKRHELAQQKELTEVRHMLHERQDGAIQELLKKIIENGGRTLINTIMETVADYYKADRCYIFEEDETGKYIANTYEWCAEGVTPEKDNLQQVPIAAMEPWLTVFQKQGSFFLNCDDEYAKKEPLVYEVLEPQNIQSLMAAPMVETGKEIGFLGVDNPKENTDHTLYMSIAATSAYHELRSMREKEKLERAIRRNKLYHKQLSEALAMAEAANHAKSDFLQTMSHDIRTPMNGIIGMTAIAAAHVDDKQRVDDCLQKITAASRHLLALINEVLDMSKIESGKVSLSDEEFNLSDLVDNLITMVRPQIAEHQHELTVNIHNVEHELVIGDSLHIQQAFINLMSNAVKYTPDGGKIGLSIREIPCNQDKVGCYEFVFQDNGIGMSEEYVSHIFEPFTRAEDSRINKIQGTGLGMPITRNIVNMMGGDIKVESQLNEGSTFTVTIFLKLQETDENAHAKFADLSVLVADDDAVSMESAVDILEDLGMTAEGVLSGEAAIQRVEIHHKEARDYNAVILDWKMLGMDGVQTARAIRSLVGNDVPIIVLTAYDWTDIEAEARAAGVNAFVSKPLFKSRLVRVFDELTRDTQSAPTAESPLKELEMMDLSGFRCLLVEDNELNAEIAQDILEETGMTVEHVWDGAEAVEAVTVAEDGKYDLVLMDIQMPKMNGYDAARAIRASDRKYCKTVPIIAMTANAFAEDVQAARTAGMNEHIAKPIDLRTLAKVMDKWLLHKR